MSNTNYPQLPQQPWQPQPPQNQYQPQQPQNQPFSSYAPNYQNANYNKKSKSSKKQLVIFSAILAGVLFIVGGMFVIIYFIKGQNHKIGVVSAGTNHTCVVLSGELYCWGSNDRGQLGIGIGGKEDDYSYHPIKVKLSGSIKMLSAGNGYTCAIADDDIYCWGSNTFGQLGNSEHFYGEDQDGEDQDESMNSLVPLKVNIPGKPISVAAGVFHACAVTSEGTYCWGRNDSGQLGVGNVNEKNRSSKPVKVNLVGEATQVVVGGEYSCALVSGHAYCWGDNSVGQLGDGNGGDEENAYSSKPVEVKLTGKVSSISAGRRHVCAVSEKRVYCWGYRPKNYSQGEMPKDYKIEVTPVRIHLDNDVLGISAGRVHSCAVTKAGVFCWGANDRGELGNGSTSVENDPWYPVKTNISGNFNDVSVGDGFSYVTDGEKIYCWGDNSYGQLGKNINENSILNPESMTFDNKSNTLDHSDKLPSRPSRSDKSSTEEPSYKSDEASGDQSESPQSQPSPTPTDEQYLAITPKITAKGNHSCAITSTGIYCWGINRFGELGNGQGGSGKDAKGNLINPNDKSNIPQKVNLPETPISVTSGWSHNCAMTSNNVYCWGGNWSGQIGDGSGGHGLNKDIMPNNLADNAISPRKVSLPAKPISMASGGGHSCAITTQGVYCWGDNSLGQLGSNVGNMSLTPVPVSLPEKATSVAVGAGFSCATTQKATYCWGSNKYGRIGNGSNDQGKVLVPTKVNLPDVASSVIAGDYHACAITSSGLYCWGNNSDGQLGNGSGGKKGDSSAVPVKVNLPDVYRVGAGAAHTCAVTSSGTYCWGLNDRGQLGNGSGGRENDKALAPVQVNLPTKATSLGAGDFHSCAMTDTGAYCWGDNSYGQLGNGSGGKKGDKSLTPVQVTF